MKTLIKDLAAITTIPATSIDKLRVRCEQLICDYAVQGQLENAPVVEIDLGALILYIKVENNTIKYAIAPNQSLDKMLKDALRSRTSPLLTAIDQALVSKITQAYKDLL